VEKPATQIKKGRVVQAQRIVSGGVDGRKKRGMKGKKILEGGEKRVDRCKSRAPSQPQVQRYSSKGKSQRKKGDSSRWNEDKTAAAMGSSTGDQGREKDPLSSPGTRILRMRNKRTAKTEGQAIIRCSSSQPNPV